MKRTDLLGIISFILLTGTAVSCKKESKILLPVVTTNAPYFVSSTMATVSFKVESNGGSKILDCGVYLGVTANPETTGQKLSVASDTGFYAFQINGLIPAKQFYMTAFATNAKGEGLGTQQTFTTPSTITDFESNVYETVVIGAQTWMAKNLQTARFQNGDPIPTTTPANLDISSETTPEYQWVYNGDAANNPTYGKLYTYYVVTDSRKICPSGWHVPSDAEWTTLENSLGGYTIAGSSLKETGNTHWVSPYNLDATNMACFTALPGGYRSATGPSSFLGNYGYWWSSTSGDASFAWIRLLFVQSSQLAKNNLTKNSGASVRCLKD